MFAVRLILTADASCLRLPPWEPDPEKTLTPLAPDEAEIRLRKLLREEWTAPLLRSLAAEWTDPAELGGWDDPELEARFLDWVSRGEVRIAAEPAPELELGHLDRGLILKNDPPPSSKKKKLSFIALELVDQDGEPVPDVPYKVELPDG